MSGALRDLVVDLTPTDDDPVPHVLGISRRTFPEVARDGNVELVKAWFGLLRP